MKYLIVSHADSHDVVYKSPQADMGYDIADYRDIDPRYGTLADVDHLIAELKQRDMKLVMDLVVNHTSHEVCAKSPYLQIGQARNIPCWHGGQAVL